MSASPPFSDLLLVTQITIMFANFVACSRKKLHIYEVCTIIIPILQEIKCRFGEVKPLF